MPIYPTLLPQPIENKLITSPYVEQAVVIGDKRKFCSAILVVAEDAIKKWAGDNNIRFEDYNELIKKLEVKQLLREEVERLSVGLAYYETIKVFVVSPRLFSIDSGELTPSLKVKRNVVEKNYADEIEAIYKE